MSLLNDCWKTLRGLVPDDAVDRARELIQRNTDSKAGYWRKQDLESVRKYWDTRENEASSFLVNLLESHRFDSILEVGCNCGNRLFGIARRFPRANVRGIDINPLAVKMGMEWLAVEGVRNVVLDVMRAEQLSRLARGSYDIVFSWATLIYVRPAQIVEVLQAMGSVACKALILIEMQNGDVREDPRGTYHPPGNWKRDYVRLMRRAFPDAESLDIRVTPVPQGIWQPSGGGASVIEVHLAKGGRKPVG